MNTNPVARSTSRRGAGVLVLILAILVGVFVLKPKDVEKLIPIVRESRISLLERLGRAEQVSGFPERTRWLAPWIDRFDNRDDPTIPFLMPATGEVAFRDVPLHPGAKLRFVHGIEKVSLEVAAGATITMSVKVRGRSGEQVLFQAKHMCEVGAPSIRQHAVVDLPPERFGDRVDLSFVVEADRALPELAVEPAFGSPVIESQGVKRRVAELAMTVESLVLDLIEEYPAATESDEELEWIVATDEHPDRVYGTKRYRDGSTVVVPAIQRARVPGFVAAEKYEAEQWGAYPALMFGHDGVVARFSLDVPEAGASLVTRIGIDRRSIAVGGAEFFVTIDGERVFARALSPNLTRADAGWHDVEVDLTKWAGKRVTLGLEGELDAGTPATVEGADLLPLGDPVPYQFDVRRVQAAFAQPRVVTRAVVPRRLAAKRDPARPSVIFVNIETLRADVLGCYGGDPEVSPEFDRFAAEGVRVDPCISVAPWTAPSVASVLTGLYPYAHGVISYTQCHLANTLDTLAERAQREGVSTAAFVSNDLIGETKNFHQGFESFRLLPYANSRQVMAEFETWLEDHADLQFFAYLHLFEPHDPCNAPGDDLDRFTPEELKGADSRVALSRVFQRMLAGEKLTPDDDDVRLLRGRYLGEIRYLDRQLGRLRAMLEAKNLLGRVVVVLTGDHGEEFCEHGMIGHGKQCFEETVAVPLVVFGPGFVPAGKVIEGPIENTALFATVLGLLDVPYDERAVEPAIDFENESPGGSAYSATEEGVRAIVPPHLKVKTIHRLRTKTRSFHFSPRGVNENGETTDPSECVAFDLESDPGETRDLSRAPGFDLESLKKALKAAWTFAHSQSHGIAVDHVDSETMRALQGLGYTAGARTNDAGALFEDGEDCGAK